MNELRRLARQLVRDTGCRFYLDATPLLEERWTGIPVVAAALAKVLLDAVPNRVRFFCDDSQVARGAVEDALQRDSGLYLQRDFYCGDANDGPLRLIYPDHLGVGIYPTVKRQRRLFPVECSIFHDLSTLITPQYHIAANIDHHMQATYDDLQSNDLSVCVSEATLTDMGAYFGIDRSKLILAHNGVSWPDWFAVQAENDMDPQRIEPYFLVLGTREPRKNIAKIFELLVLFPEVLETHRFVFVGKIGWREEDQVVPERLDKAISAGRILFTGFQPEFEKYKLLVGADATLYPSFFEGFGLPVLESLSVGTPCIASFSSSIPEVGGDLCVYHDPFSVQDLYRAVREVQASRPKLDPAFRERCRDHARRFTWEAMALNILQALAPVIMAKAQSGETSLRSNPADAATGEAEEDEMIIAAAATPVPVEDGWQTETASRPVEPPEDRPEPSRGSSKRGRNGASASLQEVKAERKPGKRATKIR